MSRSKRIKAVFLTNKHTLKSEIMGGVQICSQEFRDIISAHPDIELVDYYVPFTKKLIHRARIKLGFENYSMYDIAKDKDQLISFLESEKIEILFINMSSLIRYAHPVREHFGPRLKIILLSHGNHSGDFLHLITKPISKRSWLRQVIEKVRLGYLISTEAQFRVSYLDGVVAMSETELQIENWFGAKRTAFVPRRLKPEFLTAQPVLGRVGFVGRLDHPPNLQGMMILLEAMVPFMKERQDLSVRLVGKPEEFGRRMAEQFPFVQYLGELSDEELKLEASTWSGFLNPVWWYSTGASTKLAVGIGWGIPVFTTTAGARGYEWKEGKLIFADTPEEMVRRVILETARTESIVFWSNETKKVANSGYTIQELSDRVLSICK